MKGTDFRVVTAQLCNCLWRVVDFFFWGGGGKDIIATKWLHRLQHPMLYARKAYIITKRKLR